MKASSKSPALPWSLALLGSVLFFYLILNGGAYMERFVAHFGLAAGLFLQVQYALECRQFLAGPWGILAFASAAVAAWWGLRLMWGWPGWLRYLPSILLFLALGLTHASFLQPGWDAFS